MRIRVLPDVVINQIAAGEVVERPGSVVRELVDNAIDAGATDVFVALEGGGHSRIKVRDNGYGMSKDEAILAFERHATSKVSALDDLLHLGTLGFRGEALASIAAVSKVQLRTRERNSDVGTLVVFRGGKLTDVQSIAWNQGTEIEVEHLFFNTPARRKFLKSPRSEVARIRTWLAHSGLARPAVRYRLVSDGDEILHLQPVASLAERAEAVFSPGLIPVSLSEGGIRVEGMVSHPGQALADTTGFVVLVNGRLVSDKIVQRAVREGYDSMLKDREYPVGYLAITLPSEDVDVNVHPQKSEVRFRHPQQVFAVVQGAVLSGVRSIKRPVPGGISVSTPVLATEKAGVEALQVTKLPYADSAVAAVENVQQYKPQALFHGTAVQLVEKPLSPSPFVAESPQVYASAPASKTQRVSTQDFRFSDLRYIGQLLECYLVCEYRDALVVVDMHAAHERVNYNKIRAAHAARAITTQKLLLPEQIRLTEEQVTHLLEQVEVLEGLGFEIVQVERDMIAVCGVPGTVSQIDCVALLKECAAEPLSAGWRERIEERVDHIAARIACHASVRSGDLINRHEVYALFAQLDEAELSGACPHGRPVVAQFERDAVERWFGRDR
jgi:DNA mismatch repair protein MutL